MCSLYFDLGEFWFGGDFDVFVVYVVEGVGVGEVGNVFFVEVVVVDYGVGGGVVM